MYRGRRGRFHEHGDKDTCQDKIEQFPLPPTAQTDNPELSNNPSLGDSAAPDLDSPLFDWTGPDPVGSSLCARRASTTTDKSQTMHVGESSLFSWLVNDGTDRKRLHRTLDETHLQPDETASLRQGAIEGGDALVSPELENKLLVSFFENFYPVHPIVNKNNLVEAWKTGSVSPLLKQTVLLTGCLHTHVAVLIDAGFPNKQDAVEMFYQKARRLYDNDVEVDRVIIIQSLFMLQFRYGSATGHRDNLWWASAAVALAQIIGMHRSTKDTTMNPEERRLWKKIWWLLFVSFDTPFSISA